MSTDSQLYQNSISEGSMEKESPNYPSDDKGLNRIIKVLSEVGASLEALDVALCSGFPEIKVVRGYMASNYFVEPG